MPIVTKHNAQYDWKAMEERTKDSGEMVKQIFW